MATEITSRTVRVFQVDGKGKTFRMRHVAYRAAALQLVNAKCASLHEWDGTECRYCIKTCDGSRRARHVKYRYDAYVQEEGCAKDPAHSYRYRLVGRLARWLQWRDAASKKL